MWPLGEVPLLPKRATQEGTDVLSVGHDYIQVMVQLPATKGDLARGQSF